MTLCPVTFTAFPGGWELWRARLLGTDIQLLGSLAGHGAKLSSSNPTSTLLQFCRSVCPGSPSALERLPGVNSEHASAAYLRSPVTSRRPHSPLPNM